MSFFLFYSGAFSNAAGRKMETQGQFTSKPVTLHQYSIDNPVKVKYKGIISLLGTSKYIIYYVARHQS